MELRKISVDIDCRLCTQFNSLAIQIVDGLIFDSMLANQNIILNNNAFLLMFVIFTIIVFIFGFWIYGRIIELLYKKIIQKNN